MEVIQQMLYICGVIKYEHTMKATIENLKANRNEIIDTLISLFGKDQLVSKMNILKNLVEFAEMFDKSKNIESIIDEMSKDVPARRKTSKHAEIICSMEEKAGEYYDIKSKKLKKF